jgi:acyl phosphate:glycerol-3-phosphate acyltransferase
MDEVSISLVIAVISYLFGSISFARIISHFVAPQVDLNNIHMPNEDGSEGQLLKTVGATTASIKLGPRVGCTIGILDILKGVIPLLIIKLLYPEQFYFLIASVFVVVGHNWPIYYHFRGGGGMSPTYGGFFVVDFIGTLISALAGMIFGFFIIRDVLIAYLSGLWFYLLWMILFKSSWQYIVYAIVMNIIFIIALIPDVKDYVKQKKAGQVDMRAAMVSFPMGRGMLKIMKFFRVEPKMKSG